MIAPFQEQVLCLNFFKQLGKIKGAFWAFQALIVFKLKYSACLRDTFQRRQILLLGSPRDSEVKNPPVQSTGSIPG